jgi:elongation factor G
VRKGVEGALERGLVAGYLIADVDVTLPDDTFHEKNSNAVAFETAASRAFQKAKLAGALLEPVMAVEVVTPEENLGTVIDDLNSRRGQVLCLNERGAEGERRVAPLSTLFGDVASGRGRIARAARGLHRLSGFRALEGRPAVTGATGSARVATTA